MPDTFLNNLPDNATDVPLVTTGDRQAISRVEHTLDRLGSLEELLTVDSSYVVPTLDYTLPPGFKLSVIMPVFNEEATIGTILSRLLAQPIPMEVIIVDDHSTDCTADVLRQLEGLDNLRIIRKPKNEGKGAALREGFRHAAGDVVMVQDADLEYDPRDIPRLLRPIIMGEAEVVYGSRFLDLQRCNSSLLHRLGNSMLTKFSNRLTGLHLSDMETCYKVFRRNVLRGISIKQDSFGFEPEVTAKIARRGYRIREVPISYNGRPWEEGKKIGIQDATHALYCVVRYWWAD